MSKKKNKNNRNFFNSFNDSIKKPLQETFLSEKNKPEVENEMTEANGTDVQISETQTNEAIYEETSVSETPAAKPFSDNNSDENKQTAVEVKNEENIEVKKSKKTSSTDKMDSKDKYKNLFTKYGILAGCFILMTAVLILFTFLGKKQNRTELLSAVNNTLESYYESSDAKTMIAVPWQKGEVAFHSNYAMFKLIAPGSSSDSKAKKTVENYAFIVRMNSIFGPLSAVYIYNTSSNSAVFAGFSQLSERNEKHISDRIYDIIKNSQIAYWANRIPSIYARTTVYGE